MVSLSGESGVFGSFGSYTKCPFRFSPKIKFGRLRNGEWSKLEISKKLFKPPGVIRNNFAAATKISCDEDGFLANAMNMSFLERFNLVWKILFPTETIRRSSNANIAKQRLKMILFSDRCDVSDEAKQKIVRNIVTALSGFVEIDSEDKVQLTVSKDLDLGTIYSVTVPVKQVKPEYRNYDDEEYRGITNITYNDTGEKSGNVDVKFEFYQPNDHY